MSEPARQGASQPSSRPRTGLDQALLAKMCDLRLRLQAAKALTNMIGLRPDLLHELLPKLHSTLDALPAMEPGRQAAPISAALSNPNTRLNANGGVPNPLSPNQTRVLKLMADGLSQPEIARELWISPNTIKSHTQGIFTKLGVNTMHGAVGHALREGIIE